MHFVMGISDDRYRLAVNDRGRVFKVVGGCRRELKPQRMSNGYYRIVVCVAPKVKREFPVGRLIVAALRQLPYDGAWVANHIDADPANNTPNNLEAVTQRENVRHAHQLQRAAVGQRNGNAKLSDDRIEQIQQLLKTYTPGQLIRQGLVTEVTLRHLYHIKRGRARAGYRVRRNTLARGIQNA